MMSDELELALERAARAKWNSNERLEALESALRTVHARNLTAPEARLRTDLIHAAVWSGHGDRALVHFSWALAEHDRDPAAWPGGDLMWQYKWILDVAAEFPTVGLDRLEGLHGDYEDRLRAAGHPTRSGMYRRAVNARTNGLHQEALERMRATMAEPRSYGDDCHACELSFFVGVLGNAGLGGEALRKAEPLISGQSGCAEVPHRTLGRLAIFQDRLAPGSELALDLHRRGLAMQDVSDSKLGGAIADHVCFLVRRGSLANAGAVLAKYSEVKLATRVPYSRMRVLHAAALVAERQAELAPNGPLTWCPPGVSNDASATDAATSLREQVQAIAGAFDRRNGHDGVSRDLESLDAR
ncbi:MAG: hypothetical protein ACJAYU_001755 [Bradymonadia bacterium]|jgi:hypothetical protein